MTGDGYDGPERRRPWWAKITLAQVGILAGIGGPILATLLNVTFQLRDGLHDLTLMKEDIAAIRASGVAGSARLTDDVNAERAERTIDVMAIKETLDRMDQRLLLVYRSLPKEMRKAADRWEPPSSGHDKDEP
jgi:hypothetical protein